MDLQTLMLEVTEDPLGRSYLTMTDEQIAASLNVVDRTKLVPIQSGDLLAWAAGAEPGQDPRIRKVREKINDNSAAGKPFKAICEVADIMLTRDGVVLDLTLPDRAAFIDALVAGNVLSVEDKQSLYDLASQPASRAEELGLPFIHPINVTEAKAL